MTENNPLLGLIIINVQGLPVWFPQTECFCQLMSIKLLQKGCLCFCSCTDLFGILKQGNV